MIFKRWRKIGVCTLLALLIIAAGCTPGNSGGTENPGTIASTGVSDHTGGTTKTPTESTGGEQMQEQTTFYCAVGSVDEAAKTAKVLFANGEIATIQWDGDKPAVGTVNVFQKNGDVYTTVKARVYPPNGDSFKQWESTTVSARQKRFWKSDMYFVTNETVFFVRYSDTEWRVYQGRGAIKSDAGTRAYMYYTNELDGIAKVLQYVMVVGDYAAAGQWPAATAQNTAFLDANGVGWDSGDKDLS